MEHLDSVSPSQTIQKPLECMDNLINASEAARLASNTLHYTKILALQCRFSGMEDVS
jgi:hypothetical protein